LRCNYAIEVVYDVRKRREVARPEKEDQMGMMVEGILAPVDPKGIAAHKNGLASAGWSGLA
jgi:hypothetical protein